jgi:Tfp pilus assembly protein PilF
LRRNPALEEARINLGVAHVRLGERLRARAEAERTLELNPDSPRARVLLEAAREP